MALSKSQFRGKSPNTSIHRDERNGSKAKKTENVIVSRKRNIHFFCNTFKETIKQENFKYLQQSSIKGVGKVSSHVKRRLKMGQFLSTETSSFKCPNNESIHKCNMIIITIRL